jgi:hypothetical protein
VPPQTLATDGYRATLEATETGVILIVVRLFVDGVVAGEARAWGDDDTAESRGVAERLLPVAVAACRFLNTATSPIDLTFASDVIARIGELPGWNRYGLEYLAARDGGTDVVYEIPGRSEGQARALRIIEDRVAETFGPGDLAAWLAARKGEPDFVFLGEADDG